MQTGRDLNDGLLAGHVVWIDGPFGIGKSTVTRLLLARLVAEGFPVVAYDPEDLGERLRGEGRTPPNYHDSPLWREGVFSDIRERARRPVTVVVPQTIGRLEHYDEMVEGLRNLVSVDHFTLRASRDVLERRIKNDPQPRGEWGLGWNPEVVDVQRDPRFEVFIDTDHLGAEGVADVIARAVLTGE